MTDPLAASIIDLALGLELGASDPAGNRCSFEGLALSSGQDGVVEVRARKLEAAALRLAVGPHVVEIGRVTVQDLLARVRTEAGAMRVSAVEAGEVVFSGLKLSGPLVLPSAIRHLWAAAHKLGGAASPAASAAPADAWSLDPLGQIDGTVRSEITDAHLLFDADVTVPIRFGQIDFNDATVEHVGPDSRMGVSRMGFYVDAPNGRSYLYQFDAAPLAGVEFERRGALLSPWVSERGRLKLQPFVESMLRQGRSGAGHGRTEQARLLLGRTALSGELQLGDGALAMPGLQLQLVGRSEGRNALKLHSKAVGRGLDVELASLSARDASATWKAARVDVDAIAAKLKLQLLVEGPQLRFALELAEGTLKRLRLDLAAASRSP